MKKLLGIILFALLLSPAFAADNAVVVTPGTGVTMRSKDIGLGVQSMVHILGDTSGNPIYGTAGAANANILTVQGIAAMTPFLVTLSGTNNVNAFITNSPTVTANQGTAAGASSGWPVKPTDGANVIGTFTNYGTAPSGMALPVNAFVTNANGNGQAPMASSSPVAIASDQRVSNLWTTVPINISTATTTQLVALSGTTKIYAYIDILAGGTGNITFEYGTGSNCGTGTTQLTGPYNLTAQAGTNPPHLIVVPAGNALCALTNAAVQMSGSVTYQQF